ncbi:uncharacterized protein LOC144332960 isoform X3 [Macaca mulatta]
MGWVGRFQRASNKVGRGASLPYRPYRCSVLSPIDSQGGLLLLRGRYRERGFCGRCRFPGARLLRRGLWPQVRGGPQGPGAMNAPATSGACARTSGTGTTSPSPSE